MTASGIGNGLQVQMSEVNCVEAFSDANWAGCRVSRRSVSASIILNNGNYLHGSSRSQKSIALSSAESEFGAAVGAAIDGTLVSAMIRYISPDPTSVPQLMIDNSAARAIMQRAGVGRVRHLDVKLLWTQDRVAQNQLVVHATPTRSNVADIGTKFLSVSRTAYLLGLMNFRDATSGYERIGESQLDVDRNVHAIRNVCKDLSKIAKADATANNARILSVILVAMQASGAFSAESEDIDDHDDQSLLDVILEWFLEGYVRLSALHAAYPATCVAMLQCIFLLTCLCCAAYCCRGHRNQSQSSVQVHVGNGVTIDVRTTDRFSVPLRDPAALGPKAPGTPARPMQVTTDDEFEGDAIPYMQQSRDRKDVVAARRGARSKAMSSPRSRVESEARGSEDPAPTPVPPAPATPSVAPPTPKDEMMPVPPTPKAARARPHSEPGKVWVAPTGGKRYHKIGCGKLHSATTVNELTREQAIHLGYTSCGVCKP